MKNKLKNRRFRISVCFWILLFVPIWITNIVVAQSAQADQAIPGLINVKFTSETVVESKSTLQAARILNPEIRNILETRGFERGERIFPYFESSDTLSVSKRSGDQVVLLDLSGWYTIQVADTVNIIRLAEKLMEMPGIEAASPEYIFELDEVFPDDPKFLSNDQWGLYNFTNPGNDIHAPQAWALNTGRNDVTIAVIDGGIDHNHADLDPGDRSRIIMGLDVTTFPPSTNTMDDIPTGSKGADHGTAVAGIIGAITDNDLQVAGVMWDVKILPVKVIHSSENPSIQQSDIAKGVDYARTLGVDIINMSMSSTASLWWQLPNPMTEASLNAYRSNILFIGSAGNLNSSTIRYPAGFPWVMAIGATDEDDIKTDVSNFGNHLDVVAPGINYYTTSRNNDVRPFGGTSAAAPMVSGVAGLILSQSKDLGLNLSNDDIRNVIRFTADTVDGMNGQDFHQQYGYGRVNAYEALKFISEPNVVERGSVTGGSSTMTMNNHTRTFYRGMGTLASGTYFNNKQYEVTGQVTFNEYFTEPPTVWIRDNDSNGWSVENPNMQTPWFEVTNVTETGFNYRTYVYHIGNQGSPGGPNINAYHPVSPSNVTIEYTAIGPTIQSFSDYHFPQSTNAETGVYLGNTTIASGATLTIPVNNIMVIDGNVSTTGSRSTIRVEGKLIVDDNRNLTNIRLDIRPGGKVIIRDGVTLDTNNGTIVVATGGELIVQDDFTLQNGRISTQSGSSLTIGSGANLQMAPTPSGMFVRGIPSFTVRGDLTMAGGSDGITISPSNSQQGGWVGIHFAGSGVNEINMSNVEITKAKNGIQFTNVNALVETYGVHITESENDGIRIINSELSELAGFTITNNLRHGIWMDGGYVYVFNNMHLRYNGYNGIWMDGAGEIDGCTSVLITDNGQSGITTQGINWFDSTSGDIFDNVWMNAEAYGSSNLKAVDTWWGQNPPDTNLLFEDTGATLDYSNPSWWPNLPFYHRPVLDETRGKEVVLATTERRQETERTRLLDRFRNSGRSHQEIIDEFEPDARGYAWSILLDVMLLEQSYYDAELLIGTLLEDRQLTESQQIAILRRALLSSVIQGDERGAHARIKQLVDLNDTEAKQGTLYELVRLIDTGEDEDIARLQSGTDELQTESDRGPALISYPNPFNPVSRVQFSLDHAADVRVEVYNIAGQRVATLANGNMTAGVHTATFDGTALASGVYLVRMQLGNQVYTHKMLLVK